MSGILAYLMQRGDAAKRNVKGLLADPVGVLAQWASQVGEDVTTPGQRQAFRGGSGVVPKLGEDQEARERAMALALQLGPLLTRWYHGGRLVKAPVPDKQGVLLSGKPAVSVTPNILEAARYATHNRGGIYAVDANQFKIYERGMDKALDAAYEKGKLDRIAKAGFDGINLQSFAPEGFNTSREIALFDPKKVLEHSKEIAREGDRFYTKKFFERVGGKLPEQNPLGSFRSDKIGTGEGAQAFGYGHYVAEKPGVAKNYAGVLAQRKGYDPSWWEGKSFPEFFVGGTHLNKYLNLIQGNSCQ